MEGRHGGNNLDRGLSDRVLVWCSGYTWKEERHRDNVLTLTKGCCLLIRNLILRLLCCCLCVMIVIAIVIAIVGSHSDGSCCGVPVALGGGHDVMVTKMLIENVLALLMVIKDC